MGSKIEVENGTLVVKDFETSDDEVVSYFSDIPPENLNERFETSLKVGVVALKTIGTTERIDYIEKEFYKLRGKFSDNLTETASKLEEQINEVFGEDGKLVKEIFDPTIKGTPPISVENSSHR